MFSYMLRNQTTRFKTWMKVVFFSDIVSDKLLILNVFWGLWTVSNLIKTILLEDCEHVITGDELRELKMEWTRKKIKEYYIFSFQEFLLFCFQSWILRRIDTRKGDGHGVNPRKTKVSTFTWYQTRTNVLPKLNFEQESVNVYL